MGQSLPITELHSSFPPPLYPSHSDPFSFIFFFFILCVSSFYFCIISPFSLIPIINSHLQTHQSSTFRSNLQSHLRSPSIMPKEKNPGLKILWIWTIGTAAILVTSVMRTRLRDLENHMNAEHQEQKQQNHGSSLGSKMVETFPSSEESKLDEKV